MREYNCSATSEEIIKILQERHFWHSSWRNVAKADIKIIKEMLTQGSKTIKLSFHVKTILEISYRDKYG